MTTKKLFSKIAVTVALIIALASVSYAWLSESEQIKFPENFGGSAKASYFAGGDGSKDSPYEINDAVHMYNLAWLQYIGYFNLREGLNNGLAQSYFKLTADFDMSSLGGALPPIGTTEYPFIGNFDGQGKTITNLVVSNKRGDGNIKTYPSNARFNDADGILRCAYSTNEVEIVGAFGVTGDYNDTVSASYANMGKTLDESVMQVKSLYFNRIGVKTHTEKTLVGLVAGQVSGSVENVGVGRSEITLTPKSKDLNGVEGGLVSKYSLVGDYDEKDVGWETKPTGGAGGFGASIDMKTLNRRIGYMWAVADRQQVNGVHHGKNAKYRINFSQGTYSDYDYYWQYDGSANYYTTMYMYDGTILPLSVNAKDMGIAADDTTGEIIVNGKYHTNQNYVDKKTVGETTLARNAGYIVGAGADGYTPYSMFRTGIRPLCSGTYMGIYKSLGYATNQPSFGTVFDPSRFEMFTVDVNGNKYRIKDDVNKDFVTSNTDMNDYVATRYDDASLNLREYATVRQGVDKMMNGQKVLHGFHFMQYLNENSYSTTDADVWIYDEHHTSYQLVKGGINFSVKEAGHITAVLASCFAGGKHSLFDLFEVKRDADNKVTSFKQIDKIYTDVDGNVYYDPVDVAGKTLAFSMKNLSVNATFPQGSAFYFEIPVKAGDYVLGTAAESHTQNAYLMYLDIGANGTSGTQQEKVLNIRNVEFVNETTLGGAFVDYTTITVELSPAAADGYIRYLRSDGTDMKDGKIDTGLRYYLRNLNAKFLPADAKYAIPE